MTPSEAVCRHEAGHTAAFVLSGRVPDRVSVSPTGSYAGVTEVVLSGMDLRKAAIAIACGPIAARETVPNWWLVEQGFGCSDTEQLAEVVRQLDLDRAGYERLIDDAHELSRDRDFCMLEEALVTQLESRGAIDQDDIITLMLALVDIDRLRAIFNEEE